MSSLNSSRAIYKLFIAVFSVHFSTNIIFNVLVCQSIVTKNSWYHHTTFFCIWMNKSFHVCEIINFGEACKQTKIKRILFVETFTHVCVFHKFFSNICDMCMRRFTFKIFVTIIYKQNKCIFSILCQKINFYLNVVSAWFEQKIIFHHFEIL